jgi:flotillin
MDWLDRNKRVVGTTAGALGLAGLFLATNRVAKPSQYLVRTGFGITGSKGMAVSRRCIFLPGLQTLQRVSMLPVPLHRMLDCLSRQYMPFKLPLDITLCPHDPMGHAIVEPDPENEGKTITVSAEDVFKRYAQFMEDLPEQQFTETTFGLIHGLCRTQTANMSIDALNDDRAEFQLRVTTEVQKLLWRKGIDVVAINIAELREESRGENKMGYLQARERKKLSEAVQQSEIDVAEAEKNGEIGKKQREAEKRQTTARLEAETKTQEFKFQQDISRSHAELMEVKQEAMRRENVAQINATAAAHQCQEERQKLVEEAKANQELAKQRAADRTKKEVQAECLLVEVAAKNKARLETAQTEAQTIRMAADADRFAAEQRAAAVLAQKTADAAGDLQGFLAKAQGERELLLARAKGEEEMRKALAEGIRLLVEGCSGNVEAMTQVLHVQYDIPQKIAAEYSKALAGLQPSIVSVSGEDAGSQLVKIISSVLPFKDDLLDRFARTSKKAMSE